MNFSTASYQPVCTDKSMPSTRYYHNIIVLIYTKKGFYFDLTLNLNNKNTKEEAMNTLEKHFKIRERGSSVRTEVLAGMTTFATVSYTHLNGYRGISRLADTRLLPLPER